MRHLGTLLICFLSIAGYAQDAYHQYLQTELQTAYNISGGNWLFSSTETDNLNNAIRYGGNHSIQTASDQPFSSLASMFMNTARPQPFDAGWFLQNPTTIQQNDVLLFVFHLRSQGAEGQISFFVEDASTYAKEVYYTMPVDTTWRKYFIPIQASKGYGVQGLSAGFHLGYQAQTIEIGGFTALDFGNSYMLSELPEQVNNRFYAGWEGNAPWRMDAATRIDSLRKANLQIRAQTLSGDPQPNAAIQVRMLQHEFAFGSAINADKIAGNNAYNVVYENKIVNLDGQGHGFNWVVFENDFKWPAWEDEWFVNKTELVSAVDWIESQGLKLRGHTLVWPGNDNLPSDVAANISDIPYVKNRVEGHIEEVLTWPGLAGNVQEWDVLNETVTNTSMENAFRGQAGYPTGREVFAEIMEKTREMDSSTVLYINDFVTLSLQNKPGSPSYERLKSNVQELVNADVDLGGIGFQGHIGGFPNGIPDVLNTLDDFYQAFGLTAKITEFDMPTNVADTTASAYLEDFLTAVFSHPSVDGFLFWNFWDGATWRAEGTNLFNRDWSMTLPGNTFVNLVFDEWWTDEQVITQTNGEGSLRGFKGLYEISYTCGGVAIKDTVNLTEDLSLTIECDQLATDVQGIPLPRVHLYPNPIQDVLSVEVDMPDMHLRLFDLQGRNIVSETLSTPRTQIDLTALAKGLYVAVVSGNGHHIQQKILVE